MSIDQKALMAAQDRWAKTWNEYRDISISTVIEYYEAAKSSEQPVDRAFENETVAYAKWRSTQSADITEQEGRAMYKGWMAAWHSKRESGKQDD